jgi:hypothetical protein
MLLRQGRLVSATTKVLNQALGRNWALYHGDCVEVIKGIPDNSIHFGIHSPPFAETYIYSDSVADMGNCVDWDDFFNHYYYLIKELFRTTMPGRLVAVHCKDLPSTRAGITPPVSATFRALSCGPSRSAAGLFIPSNNLERSGGRAGQD